MTTTVNTDLFNPEILTDAVQGVFAGKDALMGSALVRSGAALVSGNMPVANANQAAIGSTITIPYFGTIGDFVANGEDTALTPSKLSGGSETATVSRDSLGVEISRWAQGLNFNGQGNPYDEAIRQIKAAAVRAVDKRLIDAAVTTGCLVKSVYSATVPVYLSYPLLAQAKMLWGDESEDIVAMLTHSQGYADLLQLTDATGRPLLVTKTSENDFDRFLGIPVVVSDRVPLTSSTMGSVTAAGTTPPTVTLSGTPLGAWDLKIKCTTLGNRGTSYIAFSTDGGQNYSAPIITAASVPLIDTTADSIVGNNGLTGITMAMADTAAAVDNTWVSKALLKCRTLLLQRGALAFWYSASAMNLQTQRNILKDTDMAAMHLYGAAKRYRRRAGGTKTGVVAIDHNVSGFIGA